MPTVSNSSPLIALAAVGRLELLPGLFYSVSIPPAVATEIAPTIRERPDWLQVEPLTRSVPDSVLRPGLGRGECEALSLGLELHAERLILDDRPARRLAQALGLRVIGTLGVMLAAKRRGLLDRVQPSLDALRKHGFFMSPKLYDQLLQLADEAQL